jgi:ribosomal protein S18 acetylase RimI-like enzyme
VAQVALRSGLRRQAPLNQPVMHDPPLEFRRGEFLISTDRRRIDAGAALGLLESTHWAASLTRPVLERAIENSVCFGVLQHERLVGFGRVVTDLATYAYWTDVVVAPEQRGQGLGHWLSDCMLAHPELQGVRRVALLTRDAAALYAGLGFTPGAGSLIYMERKPPVGGRP